MKMLKINILPVLTTVMLLFVLLLGCEKNNVDKRVDYSQYLFTDTLWERKAEHDIETIRFGSDGSFVYYCACGNPVNDSDLNQGYTYDDATKTITLTYIEITDETFSTIKVEDCDGKSIKLDFDGEIREFYKQLN